jgi:hypothetical protein
MNSVIDNLFLRRPKLEYTSPPICEAAVEFSGSSVIVIVEGDIE